MSKRLIGAAAGSVLMLAAGLSPAAAHPGHAELGFLAGFAHPLGGLDHLLAMVTVGVLAALIGGRALWLVPASFLAAMVVGAGLGLQTGLPLVEPVILASVIVLGAAVAAGATMGAGVAMALAAAFALFHGAAHGAEMPAAMSTLAYGLGFVAATAALHATGIALARLAERVGAGRMALRGAGGLVAAAGVALLLV
jgi:urease accessory protein